MTSVLNPSDPFQGTDVTSITDIFSNMTSPSSDPHIFGPDFSDTNTAVTFYNVTDLSNNTATTVNPYISLKQYTIFKVARAINSYYLWVVFAFGFPGNIVSFITILRMKPVSSPTMYVAAVAFVDNMCLLFKFAFFILTKFDARLGDEGCSALIFLGSVAAHFANWLLVAMTVERCLAICLPLKVGSICTRKLHIGGLVLTALVLLALNSHVMVTSEMISRAGDYQCANKRRYAHFLKIWQWIDAAIYAILPATLIIVMNALIVHGIHRSAKVQRELTNKASQMAETMRQQTQITVMLVVVCIAFVLLITPLPLFFALTNYLTYEENTLEHAKVLFANQIVFLLADSTHAVNFYLYFFSNRRFRKRCLETVFCYCLPRRRIRRFRGSTVSGMSKTFRLSVTDVTTVCPNAVQLTNMSSSSSSSSNHHHQLANGDTKMTRLKSTRDCNI